MHKFKKLTSFILLFCTWINIFMYDFMVYALSPSDISNQIFHYDLQDINWDNISNNPSDWSPIQLIKDKFNSNDAFQNTLNKQWIYQSNWINNKPSILFDWVNDLYEINDDENIASGTWYSEKTFAIVLSTSDDINSLQTVYEQGWKEKWYAIQIENWKLYAWLWNTISWTAWEEYRVADLGFIQTNTVYNIIINQNSNTSNNLKIYSNWALIKSITNVEIQETHWVCTIPWAAINCYMFADGWSIWVAATKNDTLRLSNNTQIIWNETNHFKWSIWEFMSWNKSLTNLETVWLYTYFDEKWALRAPAISINNPFITWIIQPWNFNIDISYNDYNNWNWIDISTDILELYKWNWTIWWADISSSLVNTSSKIMDSFQAIYPVNWITNGKYRLIYKISKSNWLEWTSTRDFYVWELSPNLLPNTVFHYDAQDIDWDWNLTNNPANLTTITTLVDKFNWYNATQTNNANKPILENNSINNYPSINFDWTNDYLDIANQQDINSRNAPKYTEKSFAAVFKTWNDVNTFQNIYEQGWTIRWYSFVVDNWHVYAWIWNNNERDAWHQYKSVDLWPAQTNTTYFAMIVQDSKSAIDSENTLKIYLNGNLASTQNHIDEQSAHGWAISIWRVNWNTVNPSDNSAQNAWHYFSWKVWELISWNHALDQAEVNWVQEYFSSRWWIVLFSEKYPIPSPTSSVNPNYTFSTNKEWTLSYNWSCNSQTTNATLWDNTIIIDNDWSWWSLIDWTYDDCSITLTDINWFDHVLNITPFTVEWTSYTLTEVTSISTPNNSHFPNYTFNSPIEWNIEYFGWCSSNTTYANIWDTTVTFNYLSDNTYSNCYLKVSNWTQTSEFLNITEFQIITQLVNITWSDIIDNRLYPIWNFDFNFNYDDNWNVDSSSSIVELQKFNSTTLNWWTDIASSFVTKNSSNNTISEFTINWANYWKYKAILKIANSAWSFSSIEKIFYIDDLEFIVWSWSIDMWELAFWTEKFSPEIEITVKTVWAWFNLILNKTQLMTNHNSDEIVDYNSVEWFWYDKEIYSWWITQISLNENIWTQSKILNTDWNKNTYTFKLKTATLITAEQAAWVYETRLKFWIQLDY